MQKYFVVTSIFSGISQSCATAVHWVFAMKYWSVAKKLQLLESNQNPEKFNSLFMWIFWIGLLINLAFGYLIYGTVITVAWFIWMTSLMQFLCILLSCVFLIDAFRLLKKFRQEHQAFSKRQVGLLSLAFGAFGISGVIFQITFFTGPYGKLVEKLFFWLQVVCFVISTLTLTILLSTLTEMQSFQVPHPSEEQDLDQSVNLQDDDSDDPRPSVLSLYSPRFQP